jgi:hypothetical protein
MNDLGWRTTLATPRVIGKEFVTHFLPIRIIAALGSRTTQRILFSPHLCKMFITIANTGPMHQAGTRMAGTWATWMTRHSCTQLVIDHVPMHPLGCFRDHLASTFTP